MMRVLGPSLAFVLSVVLVAASPASAVVYNGDVGGRTPECYSTVSTTGGEVTGKTYSCSKWDYVRLGARARETYFDHRYYMRNTDGDMYMFLELEDENADGECAWAFAWTTHSTKYDVSRWIGYACGEGTKKRIVFTPAAHIWLMGGALNIAICQGQETIDCTRILRYQVKT